MYSNLKFRFKRWLHKNLVRIDDRLGVRRWLRSDNIAKKGPDALLVGDRTIEWAWIVSHLPKEKSWVLDIGGNFSPVCTIVASLGHKVTVIDLMYASFEFPSVAFIVGDFLNFKFRRRKFDCITACSSIEQFGLEGRYGSINDTEGDIKATRLIRKLLRPEGTLLLTVPVGIDDCITPWHRIYGKARLPEILEGYRIKEANLYAKCDQKVWRKVDKETALSFEGSAALYALGLFVLGI